MPVCHQYAQTYCSDGKKENRTSVWADCVDSCSSSCPVSSHSPCELCLKRQRAAWGRGDCVRSCHMALFISPCCHYAGSGGEGHHGGKACWDTRTVSHSPACARSSCWARRHLLLGYAGSCWAAAWRPTYGALVLLRPLEDVSQHLHFNSSSVFKWRVKCVMKIYLPAPAEIKIPNLEVNIFLLCLFWLLTS